MTDTDTYTKRESPFAYRPPVDRRTDFIRLVEESGLSRNAFITQCVFDKFDWHPPGSEPNTR